MSFASEFDTQWNSITRFLESEMISQSDKTGTISLTDIEKKLENEKKRWSVPGQYNFAWLEQIRRENPAVADEFLKALDRAHLEQVKVETSSSLISAIAPGIGGLVVGLVVGILLKRGNLITVLTTLAGGTAGGVCGSVLYQGKKGRICTEARERYVQQLKHMKDTLHAIVEKADI